LEASALEEELERSLMETESAVKLESEKGDRVLKEMKRLQRHET